MSSKHRRLSSFSLVFETAVHTLTGWLGSTLAILFMLVLGILWLFSRPLFASRQDWQDIAIVPATLVTFLLIFLLQRSQNKAVLTLQLKLNEIIASQRGASNRLIDLENLSEAEVKLLHGHYQSLVTKSKDEPDPGEVHSVEEAARAVANNNSGAVSK